LNVLHGWIRLLDLNFLLHLEIKEIGSNTAVLVLISQLAAWNGMAIAQNCFSLDKIERNSNEEWRPI
jgi:hypothetical protein